MVRKLAKKKKKKLGQHPAILTEKAGSIKDLLFGSRGKFSHGTRRVVPSGLILPAHEATRIITWLIVRHNAFYMGSSVSGQDEPRLQLKSLSSSKLFVFFFVLINKIQ